MFLNAGPSRYDSTPMLREFTPGAEVLPKLQRARPYYFEDSQIVLQASHSNTMFPSALQPSFYSQVDGEKYKIHRYFLTRESEFFRDLFSLPQPGESTNVEGSD